MKTKEILITLAAFIIVVAGLRAARVILAPTLLAAFIAIICASPLFWMQRKGLPTGLALSIVVLVILFLGFVIGMVVGSSAKEFVGNLPQYQEGLTARIDQIMGWFGRFDFDAPTFSFKEFLDSGKAVNLAAKAVNHFGSILAKSFLILMIVVFMLLEAVGFPAKLSAIWGSPERSLLRLNEFFSDVKHYLVLKTFISLITGALVSMILTIIGVDYPLLWGLLAFVLNYIPNIGSIIAAVPSVTLAFIQLGLGQAGLAALSYLLLNMMIGNFIEPRVMGRGLGLSTLVVFLSLLFWGFVLGPVGMFLSVPLTITAKIALESKDETRWMALLLGPEGTFRPEDER